MNRPEISVAPPVFNEADNLDELNDRLTRALTASGRTWEIVYVDDGSSDTT
ncbi:MAG: glycosyltransferase, partial [Thermoanaerobaculia bacterium]